MQSMRGASSASCAGMILGAAPAISSTSLRRIASAMRSMLSTVTRKAPGPPITQSS
jgi:hypothetical protein